MPGITAGAPMTCATCPLFIACNKKLNPPAACVARNASKPREPWGNAMANQEQMMRRDAIDFAGDWSV